ncbi:MAG: hypothetical protein R2867_39325 [Caldilineaceae bacterium]
MKRWGSKTVFRRTTKVGCTLSEGSDGIKAAFTKANVRDRLQMLQPGESALPPVV